MALQRKKPTSPGCRHLLLIDRSSLSNKSSTPLSTKTKGKKKKGGRNNKGRITVRGRGGGHKQKYRRIDFKRSSGGGRVLTIEEDPNRSSWIARIRGGRGDFYILAPRHLCIGQFISSQSKTMGIGNSMLLKDMPLGATIHNVELQPGKGGQVIRSAGCSGLLIHKGQQFARIRFPSGYQSSVSIHCRATIGSLGNQYVKNQILGKAGRSRWLGLRPQVRGVAMNPIDHPHGGGEGKSSGGRPSVTPWGRPTKGQPTKTNK